MPTCDYCREAESVNHFFSINKNTCGKQDCKQAAEQEVARKYGKLDQSHAVEHAVTHKDEAVAGC